MKKIIYLLLAVLGFSTAGCEEHGAVMPMYACPVPEYTPSDDADNGEECSEEGEANGENL
jgi:hypothetical protein